MDEVQIPKHGEFDQGTILGSTAYIVVDNACCFYKPDSSSPVRVIPPYRTQIEIVQDQGGWVLIRFCGKEAWSERSKLSGREPPARFDISPYIHNDYYDSKQILPLEPAIEYGPRGGKFTRTKTGYRRYF